MKFVAVVCCFVTVASFAQDRRLLLNRTNSNVLNEDLLKTRYKEISGSPYIPESFASGTIILKNDNVFEDVRVRLDLYANTVQVNSKSTTIEYDSKHIKRVEFFNTEDGTFESYGTIHESGSEDFFKILYEGKSMLLSKQKVDRIHSTATETSYSTTSQKDRFQFSEDFYLKRGELLTAVKLNKKSLLTALNDKEGINDFVKKNKISFKDPDDLILLMEFYDN